MKQIEILKFISELIEKVSKSGIKLDDANYIALYDEFCAMKSADEKITYIVAVLSEKYGVSERNVYYLVKRFETCI